jgi:hypothetical protein
MKIPRLLRLTWAAQRSEMSSCVSTRFPLSSRLDSIESSEAERLGVKNRFGPGYRVYYARQGETIVFLLCGGSPADQRRPFVCICMHTCLIRIESLYGIVDFQ